MNMMIMVVMVVIIIKLLHWPEGGKDSCQVCETHDHDGNDPGGIMIMMVKHDTSVLA